MGILIVAGINQKGRREILAVEIADTENATTWSDLFKRLKKRGLSGVLMVTSDKRRPRGDKGRSEAPLPRGVLGSMMKRAVVWRYIRENPVQYVQRVKQVRQEIDYLIPDEIRRLLDASDDDYRPLYATAILTGARQGELLALQWGDLDLERGVMFIRRTYHFRYGFASPKSESGRRAVKVTPELAAILQAHKERTGGKASDLMFTNGAGNPIDGANLLSQEFRPTLERAGIRPVRFHDLRHTNAALRIASGENFKFIQQQMGHASISTTMNLYGHLLPEASEGSGQRLDALVFDNKVIHFPVSKAVQ